MFHLAKNQIQEVKNDLTGNLTKTITSSKYLLDLSKRNIDDHVKKISNQSSIVCQLKKQEVTELFAKVKNGSQSQVKISVKDLRQLWQEIKLQDPKNILANGYAYVQDMNDYIIKDSKYLSKNQLVKINFINGVIKAKIEEKQ